MYTPPGLIFLLVSHLSLSQRKDGQHFYALSPVTIEKKNNIKYEFSLDLKSSRNVRATLPVSPPGLLILSLKKKKSNFEVL